MMQAFESAVFLHDSYHNDKAAAKKLDRTHDRYEPAGQIELARVLAVRAELVIALCERERADKVCSRLGRISQSEPEQKQFRDELQAADELAKLVTP